MENSGREYICMQVNILNILKLNCRLRGLSTEIIKLTSKVVIDELQITTMNLQPLDLTSILSD